jgi:hypothetical protein
MSFQEEVLSSLQKRVLRQLGTALRPWHFYLGGGTAVALHLGHRHSLDLDWFTAERIADPMRLAQDLREEGIPFQTGQIERGTLHGTVSGVRVSFLEYRYPLLEPLHLWEEYGCFVASLDDLACMKLVAVTQRGSKKDFVDLYALALEHKPLAELLRLYQRKYSIDDTAHVLYGLAYFDEADQERLPKMRWNVDWRRIKKTLQGWLKEMING